VILLALLWISWCALHSLLISAPLNKWVQRQGGFSAGAHRLFYVGFSFVTLVPVLSYQFSLDEELLFAWQGWWRILQGILLLYAAIMFYSGAKVYDTGYFLGISQWKNYCRGHAPQPLPFSSKGVLCYVRHPWYSGSLIFIWAMGPITDVHLLVATILSLYLIIGTLLEERKLMAQIGEPYRNYCLLVPMLIPWKGKVTSANDMPRQ
jgi:protein-S-isoprenylcysteine O-methyltransferase Ste14